MAQHMSESDRNTVRSESDGTRCPSLGCTCPDCTEAARLRQAMPEFDYCIYCNLYPVKAHSDYCSDACAIMAGRE
jgi:hypothetical protein